MSIFLVDSYSESRYTGIQKLYSGSATKYGQSFTGQAGDLVYCKFYIKKVGSPTGNITAVLYTHDGTYGATSLPTGAALGTSDTIDISTLSTESALITFNFTGVNQYTLVAGTYYIISLEYSGGDVSNYLAIGDDDTTPTHDGNLCYYFGSWNANSGYDLIFYIYASGTAPTETADEILSIAKPISLKTTKEINGAWTAKMQILPDDYINAENYVEFDDELYLTKKLNRIKSKGKYYYDVTLYHNAIAELTDLTIDKFYLTDSVSDLLTVILAPTSWTAGTVDIGENILLKTDKRTTVLEALNLLAEKCGGELYFHSKTRIVDLKREIGTVTSLQLRYDKNCDYIEKEEDSTDLVTRIYPLGPDNYTINTTTLNNCEDETEWTPSGGASVAASTTIKMQGSQGVEITAAALNETFICDLGAGGVLDLSGHDSLKFWIYSATDNASGFTFGIGEAAYTDNTTTTGALTADCWKEITYDISGVADASKNAIRYIGFKNLTNGAAVAVVDMIRAFSGNIYIDSANISNYKVNKEYVYNHSAKPEAVQHELILYPTDDAEVRQQFPNTNYGTLPYLESRDAIIYDYVSYMKWGFSAIPTGATITAAILHTYVYFLGVDGSGVGVTSNVHLAAADWSENTITYNNKPAAGALIGTINMTAIGDASIDLTTEVGNWWSGAANNYGVRLFPNVAADKSRSAWYSKDGSINWPYIKVTYTTLTDPSPVIIAGATQYLIDHEEPKLSYKIKTTDLCKVMVDTWEDETINLGDTVKIYDKDLDLNINVRVKKITKNLLDPSDIDLELTNKTYSLIDAEAKRTKQLASAMPYHDNDKIVDASAVQVGYLGADVNV